MNTQELVNTVWRAAELSPIGIPQHAQWQQALNALKQKAEELDKIKAEDAAKATPAE